MQISWKSIQGKGNRKVQRPQSRTRMLGKNKEEKEGVTCLEHLEQGKMEELRQEDSVQRKQDS
jgi:hypothetical protein